MKKNIKSSYIIFIFSVLLSAIFLLSAVGKYFDLHSFQKDIVLYGFPYYFSYIIIGFELFLFAFFSLLLYLKQTSKISIVFIFIMTIVNTIGYFFLNIKSCGCFGSIYFLNPSNYVLFLFKNLILILFSIYIFKKSRTIEKKVSLKRITAVLASLIIAFISLKYNDHFIENYAKKNIGLSTKELNIDSKKINTFKYLFFFSPSCVHCQKAILKINILRKKHSIKIIGITAHSNVARLEKLNLNFKIDFPVIFIKDEAFTNITKLVPVIFKLENDTVVNVLKVNELAHY